jgi:AcrR family transcriptional regulator
LLREEAAGVPRGRPREFDGDQALDRAVDVFWRQGHVGTSIGDLTSSMGISFPSLHAAFGNKRQPFDKVMDRYMQTRLVGRLQALSLDDPAEPSRELLEGFVYDGTMPGHPTGCLMAGGVLVCNDADRDVADRLATMRMGGPARSPVRGSAAISDCPGQHRTADDAAHRAMSWAATSTISPGRAAEAMGNREAV